MKQASGRTWVQNYQWNGNLFPQTMSSPRWGGRFSGGEKQPEKSGGIQSDAFPLFYAIQRSPVKMRFCSFSLHWKGKIETPSIHEFRESWLRLVRSFQPESSYFNQSEGTAGLNYVNRKNPCIQRNNFISEFPCFQTYGSKENPNQTNEEKGDRLTRDRPTPPPGGVGVVRIKDPGCGCW